VLLVCARVDQEEEISTAVTAVRSAGWGPLHTSLDFLCSKRDDTSEVSAKGVCAKGVSTVGVA
jgi:hypothetical protein